jgi:hypothetical protein
MKNAVIGVLICGNFLNRGNIVLQKTVKSSAIKIMF